MKTFKEELLVGILFGGLVEFLLRFRFRVLAIRQNKISSKYFNEVYKFLTLHEDRHL